MKNLTNLAKKEKKQKQDTPSSLLNSLKKKNPKANIKITFSFELFNRKHDFFNLGETCSSWFLELLDALQIISTKTWSEFRQIKTYDVHPYSNGSLYEYDIPNFDEKKDNAWQFRISKSKGRVHGLFIDNIFYIHWLDPFHNMTNSIGYEIARKLKKPEICECNEYINNIKKVLNEIEEEYHMTVLEAQEIIEQQNKNN